MVTYSESTKRLFRKSRNKKLESRGVSEENTVPHYIENPNAPVPVAKHKHSDEILTIPINSTTVIGMLGPSGAGKTTADMSIVSRCRNRGRVPLNLADTDLHTTNLDNNGGVSKKLIRSMGLVAGEEPREIKQKTLLPKYLYNNALDGEKPSNVELFSLGFKDVTKSELKFLLGQGLDRNQKMSMQSVLDDVEVNEDLTFDELRDMVDKNQEQDLHHATADKLKRNINVLENSEVISSRYTKDIVSYVKDGYALGLGMKGFSRLSPDDYYLMEFYSKKCMEILIDEKKDGDIDHPMFGVFPEAHHLMPAEGDSILAKLVKRNFTFYQRRSDFPAVLDTQSPSNLPRKILEEFNHVFIGCDANGKSLAKSEWSTVLRLMNVVANPQRDNKRWMRKIQQLGHRDFLYINGNMSDPNEAPIVRFLAPLTCNP